jgi:hypothetical protein
VRPLRLGTSLARDRRGVPGGRTLTGDDGL